MVLSDNYIKDSPVFILSSPRSGSTLLRLILNSNSKISIPNEFPLVEKVIISFPNDIIISKLEAIRFINKISKNKHFQDWNIDLKGLFSELDQKDFYSKNDLIQLIYYMCTKKNSEIKIWGDKNIHSVAYISEILKIFPKAKFIHIVRDGRDVALSLKKVSWLFYKFPGKKRHYLNNIKGGALTWNDALDLINENNHLFHDANFFEFKYEELINNSKIIIMSICDFIGVKFEESMLDFHKGQQIHTKRSKHTHKNINKPILKKNSKKFIKNLTKREIKILENFSRDMLLQYGYKTINKNKDTKSKVLLINDIVYQIKYRILFTIFRIKVKLEIYFK